MAKEWFHAEASVVRRSGAGAAVALAETEACSCRLRHKGACAQNHDADPAYPAIPRFMDLTPHDELCTPVTGNTLHIFINSDKSSPLYRHTDPSCKSLRPRSHPSGLPAASLANCRPHCPPSSNPLLPPTSSSPKSRGALEALESSLMAWMLCKPHRSSSPSSSFAPRHWVQVDFRESSATACFPAMAQPCQGAAEKPCPTQAS